MIVSANDQAVADDLKTDICIVGAGAAGITLALELMNSGLDVVVLESGGDLHDLATQALYAGSVENAQLHSPPDRYRERRFGGSTTIWGGRCMPFDSIDFEQREYVAHSGWPIGLEELAKYYPRANLLCEAGQYAYTTADAFIRPLKPVIDGFHGVHFSINRLERFSCPTNFGQRYRHRLQKSDNVRVLLHANATELVMDTDQKSVRTVVVRTLAGRSIRINARQTVLATGGLEVARLLLASRTQSATGIGNTYDQVGRYYMCHLAGTIGTVRLKGTAANVHHGYDTADDGVYCRRRFALHESVQRERKISNFIARLHHPRITDPAHRSSVLSLLYLAKPFIPYEYAKRLHGDEKGSFGTWLKHLTNVVRRPFDAVEFAWHMLRDRRLAERKFPSIIVKSPVNLFSIDFHAEQEPNPMSRVYLSTEQDALGMPRLHIDWRYTNQDVETVKCALALLADDIAASGTGIFEYDEESVEHEMTRYGAYGGHHIGTARMGVDPKSSVVNLNCQVHSIDNLFIASSAVFPTSSQANPTLTIVAIALRLADFLKTVRP